MMNKQWFIISILVIILSVISCSNDKGVVNPPSYGTINILNPNHMDVVQNTVQVILNLSDSSTISQIELYLDDSILIISNSHPWNLNLETIVYSDNSEHKIYCRLLRSSGFSEFSDTISVIVNNDKVKPARINDLTVLRSTYSSIVLEWSATGDDSLDGVANHYVVKYNKDPITEGNWNDISTSLTVTQDYLPYDLVSLEIFELDFESRYYFALKAYDENNNVTFLSNSVVRETDEIPPILDLGVVHSSDSYPKITWTSPGSETNLGYPYKYEIRYHAVPINENNWNQSIEYPNEINPKQAGSLESIEVTDNLNIESCYFGIKSIDKSGNYGPISNTAYIKSGILFYSSQVIDVKGFVADVCAGDLNNDGLMDIATADEISSRISIIMNNGNSNLYKSLGLYSGDRPEEIIAVHMNDDNYLDLVVANYGSVPSTPRDYIAVFINNGNATFQRFLYNADDTPNKISGADFDNDGDTDLAVTSSYKDSILIFTNNGSGELNPFVAYNVGDFPIGISTSDFDYDGDIDIVVANWESGGISYLKNNGNATFITHQLIDTNERPKSICSNDFNLDGYIDIAFTNHWSDNISVYLNNGSGDFVSKTDYSTENLPSCIKAADINNDYIIDLIVGNEGSNSISVYLGTGSGDFQESDFYSTTGSPRQLSIADIDSDGDKDIITTYYEMQSIELLTNTLIEN
ncbi:MAG: hypothetical protein GY834_17160 [Bacteroidetes bacterium]|nr:hypothetical protein [Bacteroidota bacterium]